MKVLILVDEKVQTEALQQARLIGIEALLAAGKLNSPLGGEAQEWITKIYALLQLLHGLVGRRVRSRVPQVRLDVFRRSHPPGLGRHRPPHHLEVELRNGCAMFMPSVKQNANLPLATGFK